ncbi:NAD-dependent epimerase/dehydratase family protein [Plantibacter sp. YIM 135249]|uniref:NAD-dependent epimerase/dehydratase family protein n=1 Tax=Plantibacter sp. YIM 135249 TaxID=3423918 RepID=UPI003D3386FE
MGNDTAGRTPDSAGTWCVTGAAGSIGRALRAHLASRGVPLVSLDLVDANPAGPNDRTVRADVRDLAALEAAFAGCVGVIHLGGFADEADFHDLAEVNIVGTYHVLEAARRAGVGRVVFASSNRLTGSYPESVTVDPSMPPRPDGFYGVSKVAGEALCQVYTDKFGLSTIGLRIGSYEERPTTARESHTWLSHGDALRAFDAAMSTAVQHAVFYAVSRNRDRWWSLAEGEAIGFVPVDDAADFGDLGTVPAGVPQGGVFASPAYSLDRMQSHNTPGATAP